MMSDEENNLPTAVWVEAHLRRLSAEGISYYIVQKGAYARGTVLVKTIAPDSSCKLVIQQRDLDGKLGWENALSETAPDEGKADAYIKRAMARDPDLWVIEIEDREQRNPFKIN